MNDPSLELLSRAIIQKRKENFKLRQRLKKPKYATIARQNLEALSIDREFKDIPGHDGYQISKDGVLKYVTRGGLTTCKKATHVPKGRYQKYRVNGKYMAVHHLVMMAWGQPRPSQESVLRHFNDDQNDNHIDNLVWGTPKENSEDRIRNQSKDWLAGNYHHKQKLRLTEALEIMYKLEGGYTDKSIGDEYGIDRTSVRAIRMKRSWSYAWREFYPEYKKSRVE